MKQPSKIAAIFLTVASVLVVSSTATFLMGHRVLFLVNVEKQHTLAITELQYLVSTLEEAETGQRGYLLRGDERYLEPYTTAVSSVHERFNSLHQLVSSGYISPDSIKRLEVLAGRKLAELDQTIQLNRRGDRAGAFRIVETDIGLHLMDDFRDLVRTSIDDEEDQLQAARQSVLRATQERTLVFSAAAMANLLFLAWAYRRIKRESDERQTAVIEVHRQKDLLAITLASIGDAVIVTDEKAQISFLNEVAEKLTGWSSAESIGQPCTSIFKIINEETRAAVDSPVEKVLREGLIVGLANHTLLIRKDGSEIPIDDSGAPIRAADGSMRGVVLVFRDFSQHKEAEKQILSAKAEVEAASRAKDQFLAALSHELRTPLTPVLATLTSWEASDHFPIALRTDFQMLRRNLELEARLIDDLLDLTRIAKGKLRLSPEVADVHDLVRAIAGMYESEINSKKISLSMSLNAQRHHVRADPARLQQVFWNILKNATKFSPDCSKILIATDNSHNGSINISITDTGIGMSGETLARLFRPFEQGSENTARQYGGLGLGMAISRALMDAQGGEIHAVSKGSGLGSTFSVQLPTVPPPAQSTFSSPADGKIQQRRQLSILLVEDHTDTARVMSRLLQGLGHQVQIGDSLARAREILAGKQFDLLLSDIGLPDGTGLELIRGIRELGNHKLHAVALTGYGMEDDITKCKEAGFEDHLTKPVSFQRLEILIQRFSGEEK